MGVTYIDSWCCRHDLLLHAQPLLTELEFEAGYSMTGGCMSIRVVGSDTF